MARRRLELTADGKEVCIRFPYDEALLPVVRGLPRRRFDRAERAWFCPVDHVVDAVEALSEHGFTLEPEVQSACTQRGGRVPGPASAKAASAPAGVSLFDPPKPARRATSEASKNDIPDSLTVGDLNRRVKAAVRRAFPDELWVVGELAGFDRGRHRRHVHFELAEKDGDGEGASVAATVSAVLFERERAHVEALVAASPEPFELRDGIEVRMRVRVDVYEPRGSYQVVVESIDPVHTVGRIAQERARVLQELARRGLLEKNRSLPWPLVPLRVALITSEGSDAYNDFMGELGRSGYAFAVTVIDARMQGKALSGELAAALHHVAQRVDDYDMVAIVRGGGSKTDLAWFDDLTVAVAAASCPVKVVVGIGHHRDVGVLDSITHREKTPTAAAGALVERVRAMDVRMHEASRRLAERARARLQTERAHWGVVGRRLARESVLRLQLHHERWHASTARIMQGSRRLVRLREETLARHASALESRTRLRLRSETTRGRGWTIRVAQAGGAAVRVARGALRAQEARLTPERLTRWIERRHVALQAMSRQTELLRPERILARGFSVLRDAKGAVVRSTGDVDVGARLSAQLKDGRLELDVRTATPSDETQEGA